MEEQSKKNNINVPFSWESKPGLSKVSNSSNSERTISRRSSNLELKPPPPFRNKISRGKNSEEDEVVDYDEDIESSNFLCAVHPRISSFRMESSGATHTHCYNKEEDPFVEAYKKCTKTPPSSSSSKLLKRSRRNKNKSSSSSSWSNSIIKYMHIFSCKLAGDVASFV
ncbi:hypothetical protein PIB30_003288 [Stylosanthes scabra]|uniref:Uncharacterized protein n=1 Tax=Stylosanthes scabra TaxID=79078 RepID=A0ABU6S399_9FABA|nr:hypothetical protein [Stylosanthes scabra]